MTILAGLAAGRGLTGEAAGFTRETGPGPCLIAIGLGRAELQWLCSNRDV